MREHLPPLPEDRTLPIGCIGAGFIMADCHLPAYREAGLNVVAISSRRETVAREIAARHGIPTVHADVAALLDDTRVAVVDIAVPPDIQPEIIREACRRPHLRGILAQKPLAGSCAEAVSLVRACRDAGKTLVVNQNMRYDHAVRSCGKLLARGELGEPVLGTIEMRAIPHWMDWQQRQGWVTLRIMSAYQPAVCSHRWHLRLNSGIRLRADLYLARRCMGGTSSRRGGSRLLCAFPSGRHARPRLRHDWLASLARAGALHARCDHDRWRLAAAAVE